MRLAIDVMPLLGPGTGVATFTRGLVDELVKRPNDVELVVYALSFRGRRRLPDVVPGACRSARLPMAGRRLLAAWSRADWPPIEWWTGSVDAVHGTNYVVPPSRRRGTARVVSVHDLTSVRFPELCAPASLLYPNLIRRAVRGGAVVHTDSHAIADEVVELLGAPRDRVVTVAPGVDAPPDTGAKSPVDGPYVLALGAIEPRKNLPVLVAAFDVLAARHAELRLVVAGPDGWAVDAFDAAVAAARHRDRVVRLGYVTDPVRAALLRGASVFAYPSVYEGFGFPPLEAMAAGVPVVATAVGSLPEVLGEAAALVPPGDSDALADAIEAAMAEPDRWRAAGRANAARFTWARCADEMLDAYRAA